VLGVLAFLSAVKVSAGAFAIPAMVASLVWILAGSVLLLREPS
jgi:hypothetical protein